MTIETIGDAMDFSWRVTVRCAWEPRGGMKRVGRVSRRRNPPLSRRMADHAAL